MYLTAHDVLLLAKLVEAVHAGQRIRWVNSVGREFQGTLRHFTPQEDTGAHFAGTDIRQAWVRITLVQGHDVWRAVPYLALLLADGEASVG